MPATTASKKLSPTQQRLRAQHFVTYNPTFARIFGSVEAGIFLSQALYWSSATRDEDGWFWKTMEDWEDETALTKGQQQRARKRLEGVVVCELRGRPATCHFRVDMDALDRAIERFEETIPPVDTKLTRGAKQATYNTQSYSESNKQSTSQIFSGELPLEAPPQPVVTPPAIVIEIPLIKNGTHRVTEQDVAEYKSTFPAIDVLQTLRRIQLWNKDNPSQRKTPNGIRNHISAWMAKEQNRGGTRRSNGSNGANGYHNHDSGPPQLDDLRGVD